MSATEKTDLREVWKCYRANERGDGILFANNNREDYLFVKSLSVWLAWTGHHWEIDRMEKVFTGVRKVIEQYKALVAGVEEELVATQDLEAQKQLQKTIGAIKRRIDRLNSTAGANNCVSWSHRIDGGIGCIGDDIDDAPYLLPCSNGVVDLRTGEISPGRHDDHLLQHTDIEWRGIDEPCKTWISLLHVVYDGNMEKIDFMQRLFGYWMTGDISEHYISVFLGGGRNGKGTILETIMDIMGDFASPIESEMLLDQGRSKSSAGPSPDTMMLKGKRLVIASETDEGRRVSSARVKWLTGGDTLTGRNPHDKFPTKFKPSHKLALMTNNMPEGFTKDYAIFRRTIKIDHTITFVADPQKKNERKIDKGMSEKLKNEYPGILAWLVRGAIAFLDKGLNPPDFILAATDALRIEEDLIGQFLDHTTEETEPGERITYKELFTVFGKWWKENISETPRSSIWFSKQIVQRGYVKSNPKNTGGVVYVYGLSVIPEWMYRQT
ncbi:MAG: DNA primase [Geobacteraceae bacterium]|nr:DNA primase [Geobacteraceae bacterium]NTW81505.1 DNA primase [Geobacteraceae bacterium]